MKRFAGTFRWAQTSYLWSVLWDVKHVKYLVIVTTIRLSQSNNVSPGFFFLDEGGLYLGIDRVTAHPPVSHKYIMCTGLFVYILTHLWPLFTLFLERVPTYAWPWSGLYMIGYGTGKNILKFLPLCQLNEDYQERENSK